LQLTDNARAFIGAAFIVTALSLAVFFSGVLPGDGKDSAIVGGETVTPAVLESTATPAAEGAAPAEVSPPAAPVTAPVDVPILMYHRVGTPPTDDPMNAALTVWPDDFEAQLSYLACAGYTPTTVDRLFDAFEGAAALPANPVILTFDDGWDDSYTEVFPRLTNHGFVGSFGITTGHIDSGGPYMSWAQVQELSAAGMEITSHSVDHLSLGLNDDPDADWYQIETPKQQLEVQTGRHVDYFVYPAGEPFRSGSEEQQQSVAGLLARAGYKGALLAAPWSTTQDPATPYALNRVRVDGDIDIYSFAATVYGPDPDTLSCS